MSDIGDIGIKDVFEAFQNRIKSPIFGSISLAFIGINWKALFYLLFSNDLSIAERITLFESKTDILTLLAFPILLGTLIALIMPFINFAAAWAVSWPTTQRRLLGIKSASDSLSAREELAEQRKKTLSAIEAQDIERIKSDQKKREVQEKANIADAKARLEQRQRDEEADIAAFESRAEERLKTEEAEISAANARSEQRTIDEETEIESFAARAEEREKNETLEIEGFKARSGQRAKDEEKEISSYTERAGKRASDETENQRPSEVEKIETNKALNDSEDVASLEPIVDLSPEEIKKAEKAAEELLRAGKVIPKKIGLKVRKIGSVNGEKFPVKKYSLLRNCTFLTQAYLNGSNATDFNELSKLVHIKNLSLKNTKISNLSPLVDMQKLSSLNLCNTKVIDITPIANKTSLRILYLSNAPIKSLPKQLECKELWCLDLDGTGIDDSALDTIASLPNISHLRLDGTNISKISKISNLSQMVFLHLLNTKVTSIKSLTNFPNLIFLDIEDTRIGSISACATMRNLSTLYIRRTEVKNIKPLKNLTKLNSLYAENLDIADWSPVDHVDKVYGRPKGYKPAII